MQMRMRMRMRRCAVDSRRLDEKLAPAMEEAEIAQVWRGVKEARAEAPARRKRVIGVGIVVAAIAAAAAIAVTVGARRNAGNGEQAAGSGERETGSGPRGSGSGQPGAAVGSGDPAVVAGSSGGSGRSASGPIASADVALEAGVRLKPHVERTIAMNDGSAVALAAASEWEVLSNESDKFVTAVRKGWAHFDVKPDGQRRWIVETDLATVEVVGTAFVVERAAEHLSVKVERGVVLVRGERVPGRVVRLIAGESLEVPQHVAASTPVRPEREAQRPPPATFDSPPHSDGSLRTNGASAEDAIARADALLAKGKAIDAADELDRFLDDAGNDAGAGLAAFMLGRIAQDQLGDPERAAAAFARTLAIGSPRAVQGEARARRTRALAAAGRTE